MSARAKKTTTTTAAASQKTTTKDVVYIDVDDEITSIIDKVMESPHKIVALVLPKRATVLQSVVNMKLLKRSSDEAKKHLVLVTSEAGLLPLAGSVGLYVAKTAQSKPEIPVVGTEASPEELDDILTEDADGAEAEDDFDPKARAAEPLGSLTDDDDETIELDDEPADDEVTARRTTVKKQTTKQKTKPNKKLKVPNFNRFRLWVVLGVLGIVLLVAGWIVATTVLPKATILIETDSEDFTRTTDLTLDTTATAVNTEDDTVPAVRAQVTKTTQQQIAASGTKNLGDKAEGSVVITVCASSEPSDVPAGTGVTTNGKTFITQEKASFSYNGFCSTGSVRFRTSATEIIAQSGGTDYNVTDATFTVAGRSSASATGSASGGTDEVVKVIAQTDIDTATAQLAAADTSAIETELKNNLENQNVFAITASLNGSTPEITTSGAVGDEVDTVMVTQRVTYNMMGVQRADLDKIVAALIADDIDNERQTVTDTGIDDAEFGLQSQQNDSAQVVVSMRVTATAGPEIDVAAVKEDAAGKKAGAVKDALSSYPGVTDVEVTYSPFWVSAVPKNLQKITVEVQ